MNAGWITSVQFVQLIHFLLMFQFFTSWKHQKTSYSRFFRGGNSRGKSSDLHIHSQNIWDKLIFMWISAAREKFDFCFFFFFQEIFVSTDKIFISGGGLSTRQEFYEVFRFSRYFVISLDTHMEELVLYWKNSLKYKVGGFWGISYVYTMN